MAMAPPSFVGHGVLLQSCNILIVYEFHISVKLMLKIGFCSVIKKYKQGLNFCFKLFTFFSYQVFDEIDVCFSVQDN